MSDYKEAFCWGEFDFIKSIWKCIEWPQEGQQVWSYIFKIKKNGVYAVLFGPNPDFIYKSDVDSYCGYLCKDKRLVLVMSLIVIPFIIIFSIIFYRLFFKKLQLKNRRSEY